MGIFNVDSPSHIRFHFIFFFWHTYNPKILNFCASRKYADTTAPQQKLGLHGESYQQVVKIFNTKENEHRIINHTHA